MHRTHYCGELRKEHMGQAATCCGWVQTRRDMGGVIFLDLKDREGVLQVVCDSQYLSPEDFHKAETVHMQSVIEVSGTIRHRDEETYNPRLATGEVELKAEKLTVLSEAKPLPFSLDEDAHVREELRLKYRYLDIRRPAMQKALKFRHQVQQAAEHYLDKAGFYQVETPMLCKSTPEGARDYLVPSRVHPGTFYALPQSPQIFKQLLMVGGIDKYYQVARCFRDEDLRADRQPEFTQVDMEMSFVEQEDILQHLERLFKSMFKEVMGREIDYTFPRLTWKESMDKYGCDKPDLRFGLTIRDVTDIAASCSFSVFRKVADQGGVVRAINCKGCAEKFTRSTVETLTDHALGYGAKGMAWILIHEDGEVNSILQKYFTKEQWKALLTALDAENGDFILFCADKFATVCRTLCGLRLEVGDMLGLRRKDDFRFCFVTDFPQFEWSEEEGRYLAMHHPFTMPYEEDLQYLLTDPGRVRSQSYDTVLNGVELGSGSIRIHRSDVQALMFKALGFSEEEAQERFGFLIGAFQYGTPPHGGFAFGLDRLVMLLLGADSLRDVIAFPKVKDASCLMTGAPDFVDPAQLEVLKLGVAAGTEEKKQEKKRRPTMAVRQVAELAKLSLSPEEEERMGGELNAVLSFAEALSQLDTTDVPMTAHVIPVDNVFREDVPVQSLDREALLSCAPTRTEEYVTVPKTFE